LRGTTTPASRRPPKRSFPPPDARVKIRGAWAIAGLNAALGAEQRWPLVACAGATAFLLYALRERGYFWLVVMVTPTALLMLSAVAFEGDTVAFDRVSNSFIGIVIGLALAELARLGTRISSPLRPRPGHSGGRGHP
jgi:hypothetical protein